MIQNLAKLFCMSVAGRVLRWSRNCKLVTKEGWANYRRSPSTAVNSVRDVN
jgi:hypothetical protein